MFKVKNYFIKLYFYEHNIRFIIFVRMYKVLSFKIKTLNNL